MRRIALALSSWPVTMCLSKRVERTVCCCSRKKKEVTVRYGTVVIRFVHVLLQTVNVCTRFVLATWNNTSTCATIDKTHLTNRNIRPPRAYTFPAITLPVLLHANGEKKNAVAVFESHYIARGDTLPDKTIRKVSSGRYIPQAAKQQMAKVGSDKTRKKERRSSCGSAEVAKGSIHRRDDSMKKMLRLTAIFVLMVSTFVGSSSAVSQVEASVKPEVAPAVTPNVNAKIETTTILVNNDSLIVAPSVRPDENKKDSPNDTKVPQQIANPNETEKQKKSNSTKESYDMRNFSASPEADSGEATEGTTIQSAAESTTIVTAVTKKTEASKTESQTPKPSPEKNEKKDDKDKDAKKKDDKEMDGKKNENVTIIMLNATQATNQVSYETAPAETSDVKNTNRTGDGAKPATPSATVNITATSTNPVVPLGKVANVGPIAAAEAKSADRNKSMPSGIIALVTAISFGVAIAIVYIGMIVWRRYVEYRYGHRELLVNELEFDTNDLRHFEL